MGLNLVLVGGMSECGKSHACRFLSNHGFHHKKIIWFEKLVFDRLLGSDRTKDHPDFLACLYGFGTQRVFGEVKRAIEEYCSLNDIANLVMDSTTRLEMVEFFKNSSFHFASLYIRRDLDKRVDAEWRKLGGKLSQQEVRELVASKDAVKLQRGADRVKEQSIQIDNNGTVADFESKLLDFSNAFLTTANK